MPVVLYSGNVIRIDANGVRIVFENAKVACANTPCANANGIGRCALGFRHRHANCTWEFEHAARKEGEEWREDPVTQVVCSNMGRYCLKRTNGSADIVFEHYGHPNIHGYLVYTWNKTSQLVHRMIARAFLGPSPVDAKGVPYDVDHINGDKKDNRASNLQYMSRTNHCRKTRKTTTFRYNQHTRKVVGIADTGEEIEFESLQKAAEFVGCKTVGGISNACRRSSMVGEWNVQYEGTNGKEPPEFGGFSMQVQPGTNCKVFAWHRETGKTRTFASMIECAKGLGYSKSIIHIACRRSNRYKGYFWRFANSCTIGIPEEEWRESSMLPIEVSSHGRIRMRNGIVLDEFSSWGQSSYKRYNAHFVHRLVADAFLGKPPLEDNGRPYDVDHLDGDPSNNHAANLKYLSRVQHNRKTHGTMTRGPTHKRHTTSGTIAPSIFKRGKYLKQRKSRIAS